MLETDPIVLTLTQRLDELSPVLKTPINRLFTPYFKADGGRIERPQYFRLDNTGQQGLEVTNIAFNTTTTGCG